MSFLGSENVLWFDGKFVSDKEASVSVMSHTLHYGSGVFEGVRAYSTDNGPAIFRLEDHTKRFFNSARLLGMELPFDEETLNRAQKEVISRNKFSSAYIRPVAFYSDHALGVYPKDKNVVRVVIAAWEWENYFNIADDAGMDVVTSTFKRQSVSSVLTKAKVNGYYVNSMLALQEAKAKGYQEAVLFDANGFIAEGSSANIFLVKDGVLYTPTDANILPGITRASVIQLAGDFGLQVIEKNLTRDELYLADEFFFTGTAAEVSPVGTVDGLNVGSGKVGSITAKIRDAYHQTVQGKNKKYLGWNAHVE